MERERRHRVEAPDADLEWVDNSLLLVTGAQVADVEEPSALLREVDGISIQYEMRDIR